MIFIFDLDGAIIQSSEKIFSKILEDHKVINRIDYIRNTLVEGNRVHFIKHQKNRVFNDYRRHIGTFLKSSSANEEKQKATKVLSLLSSREENKCFLLTSSPKHLGELIINSFGIANFFTGIEYDCKKFNNKSFYLDFIDKLGIDDNEKIFIVEDSFYQIQSILNYNTTKNIKAIYFLNLDYEYPNGLRDQILETINSSKNVVGITDLYEIISETQPLTYNFSEYLPYNISSAPTLLDDLGLNSILYREIYKIGNYLHIDSIDDDSFDWVERRVYFIIFSLFCKNINRTYNQVLLKMDFSSGHVNWLLPGGSLRPELGKDYIDLLFNKITAALLNKPEIKIRNLYPVANLTNVFISPNGRIHKHIGIGWTGVFISSDDILNKFSSEIGNFENTFIPLNKINSQTIRQSPNRSVFNNVKDINPQFDFEKEGDLNKIALFIHNLLIKPIFSLYTEHKNYISRKIIESEAFSFFDVSCGDDYSILNTIIKSKIRVAVLNDVSSNSIFKIKNYIKSKLQNKNNTYFFYTMQDAIELGNIRDSVFDFILCKNTLHHFPSRKLKESCLHRLKNITRKNILIMDVEYPIAEAAFKKSGFQRQYVRLRHNYYMRFLGESGPEDMDTAFLGYSDFQTLIASTFTKNEFDVEFKKFESFRASYMVAFITKKLINVSYSSK